MSKEPFLTVYGHVSIDQIISLREFPQVNTSVDITDKRRYLGGTGGNIATIAARLGVPTAICSYVGNDFPSEYRRFMQESGLILDELVETEEYETSTALIVNNQHNDQITYFYQGPMGHMDPEMSLTGMAERSKMVHFSTGNPEYYIRVMQKLEDKDISISLDPAQEVHRIWTADTFQRAVRFTDILFSNQYEMSSMLRYMGLKSPAELPVDTLVLTKGKEGAEVWRKCQRTAIPSVPDIAVKDTTGAGDGFRAGFYAGLYRKYDIQRAAILGAVTASFIIESIGSLSRTPTWEEVLTRAEEKFDF